MVDDSNQGTSTPNCPAGFKQCSAGCTLVSLDPNNCGACGVACEDNEVCYEGECVVSGACPPGQNLCDETCADLLDDDAHCGTCFEACTEGTCFEGKCVACEPGSSAYCYSGSDNSIGVGTCHSGLQVCEADGSGYGPCIGEVIPEIDDCFTLVKESCDASAPTCFGLQSASTGFGSIAHIAPLADGSVIAAGSMSIGQVDFGGGPVVKKRFIVRFGPTGAHEWTKSFSYAMPQAISATGHVLVATTTEASVDLGGGPLTGMIVGLFDPTGKHLWSKSFTAQKAYTNSASFDANNNVIIAGRFEGTLDLGDGNLGNGQGSLQDAFIAKLDVTGKHIWSKRLTKTGQEVQIVRVRAEAGGDVMVGLTATGTIDFGGGDLVSLGNNKNVHDIFLAKLNSSGQHQWSKRFGDASAQMVTDIALGPSGDVFITGKSEGNVNFGGATISAQYSRPFNASFSAQGTHKWSHGYSSSFNSMIRVSPGGDVYMVGHFTGTLELGSTLLTDSGKADLFVAKLGSDGKATSADQFGDYESQNMYGAAFYPDGWLIVTGIFRGQLHFESLSIKAGDKYSIFLAQPYAKQKPN